MWKFERDLDGWKTFFMCRTNCELCDQNLLKKSHIHIKIAKFYKREHNEHK